jgi:hypothetical protein
VCHENLGHDVRRAHSKTVFGIFERTLTVIDLLEGIIEDIAMAASLWKPGINPFMSPREYPYKCTVCSPSAMERCAVSLYCSYRLTMNFNGYLCSAPRGKYQTSK